MTRGLKYTLGGYNWRACVVVNPPLTLSGPEALGHLAGVILASVEYGEAAKSSVQTRRKRSECFSVARAPPPHRGGGLEPKPTLLTTKINSFCSFKFAPFVAAPLLKDDGMRRFSRPSFVPPPSTPFPFAEFALLVWALVRPQEGLFRPPPLPILAPSAAGI